MPRFNFKSPPPNPLNATPTASEISPPQSQPAVKLSHSVARSYMVARHIEKAKYPNPLPLLNILPSSILNQLKASVQISLRSGISQSFLRQKMQQAMGKQMNTLQVYAVRNLFSVPHSQDARFWDFLTSDETMSGAFVDVSSGTEFSKEGVEKLDEELENLYKRYVKARLTLAGNRHRMAKINERLVGQMFSREEDSPPESPKQTAKRPPRKRNPEDDDEDCRLPLQQKETPSLNVPRRRKRTKLTKASSNQHMTPSQISLARKVTALTQSKSLKERCQKIEQLAVDLKITRYRLEKFLEGDQLKLINAKIHKETENILERWLIQRDAVL